MAVAYIVSGREVVDIKPREVNETLALKCLLFHVKSLAFYPKIIWNPLAGRAFQICKSKRTAGLQNSPLDWRRRI